MGPFILMRAGIAFAAVLAGLLASGTASAAGSEPVADRTVLHWPLVFEPTPVHTETARLLTVHDDELVIARIKSRKEWGGIDNVGRWDGTDWKPMGSLQLKVHAFASFASRLVAGGADLPADAEHGALAMWHEGTWERFGEDLDGTVLALAVWRDRLVVGGRFSVRGLPETRNLITWDGRAWRELPTDGLGGGDNNVRALSVLGDDLIIGGTFAEVAGTVANNVARYDGRRWHDVGGGTDGRVDALVVHDGVLYAAGSFGKAGASVLPSLAAWDGLAWRQVGGLFADSGPQHRVNSLKSRDGRLLAAGVLPGGLGGLATWDGSTWRAVGPEIRGAVDSEIFHSQLIAIATGERVHPGDWDGADQFSLVTWTGVRWQWLHAPTTGIISNHARMALHAGELVVAGRNGPRAPAQLEAWRNGSWTTLATFAAPLRPLRLRSTAKDLFVLAGQGGQYQDSTCVVLRRDGGVLRQVGSTFVPAFRRGANLAVHGRDVAVIGARDPQGSAAASMSDGRPAPDPVWSVFTLGDGNWAESPLPDGCVAVTDAAAITDGLFVAGVVDSAGIIAPRIWLRGDAGWRRVWSHSSGVIPFLQNTDDGLWAAVQRADPDSLMPPPLLHWEEGRWRAVGTPLLGHDGSFRSVDVQAMTVHRGEPVMVVRRLAGRDGTADTALATLVWREACWRRVADFLPNVAGLLGGDKRLWIAEAASGSTANLPLTWTDEPLETEEDIAPMPTGWWQTVGLRTTPLPVTSSRSQAAVRIAPRIALPAKPAAGDTIGEDAWHAFEAGKAGWIACPRERPVGAVADPTIPAAEGSLTALLDDARLVGFNYRAVRAGTHKVSYRWRLSERGVPLRSDPQGIPVVSLIVGGYIDSEDAAYRYLRPGAAPLDDDGFAHEAMTVSASESSLVRFQLDCGFHSVQLEVEDFRVDVVPGEPVDDYERLVEFLTTRYRLADGTVPDRGMLPEIPADRDAAQRITDLLAELRRRGLLGDPPRLPEEELVKRRDAWDRCRRALDAVLVNRAGEGEVIGWLPGDIFYLRCVRSRQVLAGLGEVEKPGRLRNLGPRTGVMIDLRAGPDSRHAGEHRPGNEAPYWVDALVLASRLTDAPVDVVGYRGEEGFTASPAMRPFAVTGAGGADEPVVLRARPEQGWLDHGPLVVLTDPWSDALTVLALKGRPGVTVIGESARGLPRPATAVEMNAGSFLPLPTGVVTTPTGANVLVDGVVPDEPVTFVPERDQALERGLEILRRAAGDR